MLQIVIACTRNGQFVPTGIETDVDTFIALPEALSLTRCPACGGNHYWTKSQAWICNIFIAGTTACRGCRRPLAIAAWLPFATSSAVICNVSGKSRPSA